MTTATSSASPRALFHYADAAKSINELLEHEAGQLEAALSKFAMSCTEFRTGVGPSQVEPLRAYLRLTKLRDEWVRQVGGDFLNADHSPASPWVTAPFAAAGMIPFALSGVTGAPLEVKAAKTVRGSAKPGPGETLVGSSRSQMRYAAAKLIASDPAHPLRFLLDPGSKKFKPHRGFRKGPDLINRLDLVEMSHIRSNKYVKKYGGPERLMLEIAWDNQYKNWTIERSRIGGAVLGQKAISIGGVAVSKQSALVWESLDPPWLKPGTAEAAPVVEPWTTSDATKPSPRPNVKGSIPGGTLVRGASRGLFVAGAAIDTYNIATADNKVKESVKVAAGWAGAWAGAKGGAIAGAAIGSFFPGPGNAIGAVAGGLIGGAAGYVVGSGLGEKIYGGLKGLWD